MRRMKKLDGSQLVRAIVSMTCSSLLLSLCLLACSSRSNADKIWGDEEVSGCHKVPTAVTADILNECAKVSPHWFRAAKHRIGIFGSVSPRLIHYHAHFHLYANHSAAHANTLFIDVLQLTINTEASWNLQINKSMQNKR